MSELGSAMPSATSPWDGGFSSSEMITVSELSSGLAEKKLRRYHVVFDSRNEGALPSDMDLLADEAVTRTGEAVSGGGTPARFYREGELVGLVKRAALVLAWWFEDPAS